MLSIKNDAEILGLRRALEEEGWDDASINTYLIDIFDSNIQLPNSNNSSKNKSKISQQVRQDARPGVAFLWEYTDEEILSHIKDRFDTLNLEEYDNNLSKAIPRNGRQIDKDEEEKLNMDIIKTMMEEEELAKAKEPKGDCQICLEKLASKAFISLQDCPDIFHIECLEEYLVGQIQGRRFPIKCPNVECKRDITESDVKDSLQTQLQYQLYYDDYNFKFFIDTNPDQYLYCPTPNCGYVFCDNNDFPQFDCPKCQKSYCTKCKIEWHNRMTCEEFAQIKRNQTDEVFFQFADQMRYKQCPQCRFVIEKYSGCNHMSCSRCQTQFCYGCGRRRNGECQCG